MNCELIDIDIAKNAFQICQLGEDNKVRFNRKVARKDLIHKVRQLPDNALIVKEACGERDSYIVPHVNYYHAPLD